MTAKTLTASDRTAPSGKIRLLLFASGDFAFNLYWQSIMLFLLFYYTDALGIPIATAAAIYAAASVWDGIASFGAGVIADRYRPRGGYRRVLMVGSVPLAFACILTYAPPLGSGWAAVVMLATGHFLFRTAYAAVNVPYLAMTARISLHSRDRAFVAGARMLFGTLAWVTIASATVPVGTWLSGSARPADAYLGAAFAVAATATLLLILVGATVREEPLASKSEPQSVRAALASLAGNRAFVTLNLAMVAMIVAVTMLNKSVLYYFKYFLGDDAAGQSALAWMGLVSAMAVPLWMLLQRPLGTRNVWFVAAGALIAGLALFAAFRIEAVALMQIFLLAMQAFMVGLHFAFWAMLPNTIEYGEQATGVRVEGTVFGMAALLQRVAIGIATALLGLGFDSAGYVANVGQSADTLSAMHRVMVLLPLAFLALSCALMVLNPLGKGAHARLVESRAGSSEEEG